MAKKSNTELDELPSIDADPELWQKNYKLALKKAKDAYMAGYKASHIAKMYGIPFRTLQNKIWSNRAGDTRATWKEQREEVQALVRAKYAISQEEKIKHLSETERLGVMKLREAITAALSDTSTLRYDEIQKLCQVVREVQGMVRLEEGKATEIKETRHVTNKEVLGLLEELQKGDRDESSPGEVLN